MIDGDKVIRRHSFSLFESLNEIVVRVYIYYLLYEQVSVY